MLHHRGRLIAPAALLALLALVPAAVAKTVTYKAHLVSAPLATGSGYPAPGGTAVLAGTLTFGQFGNGASIAHVTITGQPQPNVFAFKGTELDLVPTGSVRNRFTGTSTVQPDGSQQVKITGRFTGGTGRFRGATGSYAFTGTAPAGSMIVTGDSTGRIVLGAGARAASADEPTADASATPQFAPRKGVRYAVGITTRNGHFVYYDVADPSRTYRPARGVQLAKGWVIRNGRLQRVS